MAKIAKTADRKKVMDTTKSTDCPKCGKPTQHRIDDRRVGPCLDCLNRPRESVRPNPQWKLFNKEESER